MKKSPKVKKLAASLPPCNAPVVRVTVRKANGQDKATDHPTTWRTEA